METKVLFFCKQPNNLSLERKTLSKLRATMNYDKDGQLRKGAFIYNYW